MSAIIAEIQEQYVKLLYLFEHGGDVGLIGTKDQTTVPFPAAWKRDLGTLPVYVLDDPICRAILADVSETVGGTHVANLVFHERGEWLIATTPHQFWLHIILPDESLDLITVRYFYCRNTSHCMMWPFEYKVVGTEQSFVWSDFSLPQSTIAAVQRRFTPQDMRDFADIAVTNLTGLNAVLNRQPEIVEQPWQPRSMAEMISRSRVAKGRPALINIRTVDLDAVRRLSPDRPPSHAGDGSGGTKSPHDRVGHPRVLYRGTERERTIMIPPIKVKGGAIGTITVVKASKHQTADLAK